jgi:hypothetical protein
MKGPVTDTLTVHIPMALRKHGRCRSIVLPQGAPAQRLRVDNAMVKTLARAFRWRRILESGTYTTIADLAAAEKIDPSYLSRVLRLTTLAPDIIEAAVSGSANGEVMTARLRENIPADWESQRRLFAKGQ